MIKQILPLDREKWQGHPLTYRYVSHAYYDVEVVREGDDFRASFVKKKFDAPFEKVPGDSSKLFQPYFDDVKAWGVAEGGRLAAAIETAVLGNRLRVTNLWVDGACRRAGIGKALMDIAAGRAREEKRRALVLETQSCNEGAIAFYLAYGFTLIGFDACAYRNDDLSRKEVRLELGMELS